MKKLQKIGGFAALFEGFAYITGMLYFLLVLDYSSIVDPAKKIALLENNQTGMYLVMFIIYVAFGIAMVLLSLSLYERLKKRSPVVMQIAAIFGFIWATLVIASGMVFNIGMEEVIHLFGTNPEQAATAWLAIETVHEAIGGGNEIVGGIWILLISIAALKGKQLHVALNYLGLAVGVAGIVSTIPPLGELGGMVFGAGQIVWFIWLGIYLIISKKTVEA